MVTPPHAADPGTPPPLPTTTTSIISSLPAWLIGGPVTDSLINSLISARALPAQPQPWRGGHPVGDGDLGDIPMGSGNAGTRAGDTVAHGGAPCQPQDGEWGRCHPAPRGAATLQPPPPASPHACLLGNGPASAPLCPQITAPAAASEAPVGSGGTTAATPQPREGRGLGFGQQSGPPASPLGCPATLSPPRGVPGPLCPHFVPSVPILSPLGTPKAPSPAPPSCVPIPGGVFLQIGPKTPSRMEAWPRFKGGGVWFISR